MLTKLLDQSVFSFLAPGFPKPQMPETRSLARLAARFCFQFQRIFPAVFIQSGSVMVAPVNGGLLFAHSLALAAGPHRQSITPHSSSFPLTGLRSANQRHTFSLPNSWGPVSMSAISGVDSPSGDGSALRTMFSPPWSCVSGCAACCYLAPEERDLDCLSDGDRELYVSMAAADGGIMRKMCYACRTLLFVLDILRVCPIPVALSSSALCLSLLLSLPMCRE